MKVIDLENIKIVSVNRKNGVSKDGRIYPIKAYADFKKLIAYSCVKCEIEPPYSVIIEIETYIDITNFEKCIIDGIQEAGAIDNDKNVLRLTVIKTPIPKNRLGNLCVMVEHYI